MTFIKYRPVIWKCRTCGTEGRYIKWGLDSEEDLIHAMTETKLLDECPKCTDGIVGGPETEQRENIMAAMMRIVEGVNEMRKILADVEERLSRLEGRKEGA